MEALISRLHLFDKLCLAECFDWDVTKSVMVLLTPFRLSKFEKCITQTVELVTELL